MSASDLTATSAKTAWRSSKTAPRSGRSTRERAPATSSPVALAIRSGSTSTPGATGCAAVNERDEIGSDLVPDYITSVREGAFYGWPYSYYGQHVDVRVKPPRPDLVARAIPPDFAVGAHVAALGLTFSTGQRLGL